MPPKIIIIKRQTKRNIFSADQLDLFGVLSSEFPRFSAGPDGIICLRFSFSLASFVSNWYVCTDIISWLSLSWPVAAVKPK